MSSRSNPQTDFPSAEAGKTAYYALRWVSTRGEKGPWSEVAAVAVAAYTLMVTGPKRWSRPGSQVGNAFSGLRRLWLSPGAKAAFAVMPEKKQTTNQDGQTAPGQSMQFFKDAAEWLRVTLSCIGDGVITTDPHGKVTSINPVAQALTGWTQAEAGGHPLEEVFRIVNEDTRAEVENPALRALRDGVIVGLANHTILISRDGTERPIDDSAAPIRNSSGEVHGAILVFRDITQRRQSEEKLRDSEMRYRRLFQAAKDGILILDAKTGRITDANAFMGGLIGVEAHELVGKELHEIGMFGDTEASKTAFRVLQEKGYLRYEHLPVQNRQGGIVEVEVVANIYQEDHTLVAQCNVRDISQRVVLEKKIVAQAEQLAGESRRKDEFLAMLSHELRNPLAPIRSAVHLLRSL